ncbi:hypothetical protein B1J94_01200 [Leptospira kirschneri serovar Grippotyphosa]|nr:hypothetical protein B1J94_01200 [Leptospira kirschneri serovar Grippotyphosa]
MENIGKTFLNSIFFISTDLYKIKFYKFLSLKNVEYSIRVVEKFHSSINKTISIDRFYEIENRWRINFSTTLLYNHHS